MRATVGSLAVLIVFALTTTPFAAEQTWTGKIGDSACNLKHESGEENVPPPPDKECTLNCVRGGSDFVLLSGGKIYKIANQKDPALKTLAGDEVKVTGELKGDVITASK